jgi:hypothetical protein
VPALVALDQRAYSCGQRRRVLPFEGESPIVAGLTEVALAARRFFDLVAHGAKVVRGGNHGEQDDEHASQSQETLQRAEVATDRHISGAVPQPECG